MSTFHRLSCLAFLLPALALAVPAAPGAAAPKPSSGASSTTPPLQVQLNLPASWVPIFDSQVEDAFVSRVSDVFHRNGYKGDVREVSSHEEPDAGCCLLSINLIEWRMNPVGNIECTFTATLQTADKTRNLGIFTDTAFQWMSGPGRFGLSDAFGQAANGALRQLYDHLARTALVPGLPTS